MTTNSPEEETTLTSSPSFTEGGRRMSIGTPSARAKRTCSRFLMTRMMAIRFLAAQLPCLGARALRLRLRSTELTAATRVSSCRCCRSRHEPSPKLHTDFHIARVPLQRGHAPLCRHIPHAHRIVVLPLAMREPSPKLHTVFTSPCALEACHALLCRPHPTRAPSCRCCRSRRASRRPSCTPHSPSPWLPAWPRTPCRHIPHAHRLVAAAARDARAVAKAAHPQAHLSCALQAGTHAEVATSHTRTVLSLPPLAMREPSPKPHTALTMLACLKRGHALLRRHIPHAHRLVVAAARDARAVAQAAHRIHRSVCPLSVATHSLSPHPTRAPSCRLLLPLAMRDHPLKLHTACHMARVPLKRLQNHLGKPRFRYPPPSRQSRGHATRYRQAVHPPP